VSIPANTTASLTLATPNVAGVTTLKDKEGVDPLKFADGKVITNLKSGTHEFEVKNSVVFSKVC
jgi:hypothetical protein